MIGFTVVQIPVLSIEAVAGFTVMQLDVLSDAVKLAFTPEQRQNMVAYIFPPSYPVVAEEPIASEEPATTESTEVEDTGTTVIGGAVEGDDEVAAGDDEVAEGDDTAAGDAATNLVPFIKLESTIEIAEDGSAIWSIPMYSGKFVLPGQLSIYFGYRLVDGTVVTNEQPMEVSITEPAEEVPVATETVSDMPAADEVVPTAETTVSEETAADSATEVPAESVTEVPAAPVVETTS